MAPPAGPSAPPGPPSPETTQALLTLARAGDDAARERLFARFLPRLELWAHRRLPTSARGLADTDDLVQVTLVRALNRIDAFEPRREELDERLPTRTRSQLDDLIGAEMLARYDQGLASLPEEQREAVILRLEFGYSHAEVADALGKSSPDAARMTIARALAALGAWLDDVRTA